jgi:predicted CoA-binding protein
MSKPTVAIVGASNDRAKFGNKAVRAFLEQGYDVYPVHPTEPLVEGLKAYKSVLDIPVPLDKVSLYVQPRVGMQLIADVAKKGCREVWLNPGADSPELYEKALALGLNPIVACSIVGVGADPREL